MQFDFNKEKELKEREENHLMTNIVLFHFVEKARDYHGKIPQKT